MRFTTANTNAVDQPTRMIPVRPSIPASTRQPGPRTTSPYAEIHWQRADGDVVTTYKTYHGTHNGEFLGIAPTGRKVQFETVDAMRVQNGKITEHWGVANLFSLVQQLGATFAIPRT